MAFHSTLTGGGSSPRSRVPPGLQPSSTKKPSMEVCPYSDNHQVMSDKMDSHLLRCRQEYKKSCKQVPVFSCKYNFKHQVPAPELMYHEARCKDAEFVPTYLLNVGLQACKDSSGSEELEEEELKPSEGELEKMYEGLYVDTFIGSASWGKPVAFDKMRPGGFQNELLEEWNEIAPKKEEAEPQPSTSGAHKGGVNVVVDKEGEMLAEEDDDEEEEIWQKGDNRPPFSYMDNFLHPTKPLHMYPPMLTTKSQRREFLKWNKEWTEAIEREKALDEMRSQARATADEMEEVERVPAPVASVTISLEELWGDEVATPEAEKEKVVPAQEIEEVLTQVEEEEKQEEKLDVISEKESEKVEEPDSQVDSVQEETEEDVELEVEVVSAPPVEPLKPDEEEVEQDKLEESVEGKAETMFESPKTAEKCQTEPQETVAVQAEVIESTPAPPAEPLKPEQKELEMERNETVDSVEILTKPISALPVEAPKPDRKEMNLEETGEIVDIQSETLESTSAPLVEPMKPDEKEMDLEETEESKEVEADPIESVAAPPVEPPKPDGEMGQKESGESMEGGTEVDVATVKADEGKENDQLESEIVEVEAKAPDSISPPATPGKFLEAVKDEEIREEVSEKTVEVDGEIPIPPPSPEKKDEGQLEKIVEVEAECPVSISSPVDMKTDEKEDKRQEEPDDCLESEAEVIEPTSLPAVVELPKTEAVEEKNQEEERKEVKADVVESSSAPVDVKMLVSEAKEEKSPASEDIGVTKKDEAESFATVNEPLKADEEVGQRQKDSKEEMLGQLEASELPSAVVDEPAKPDEKNQEQSEEGEMGQVETSSVLEEPLKPHKGDEPPEEFAEILKVSDATSPSVQSAKPDGEDIRMEFEKAEESEIAESAPAHPEGEEKLKLPEVEKAQEVKSSRNQPELKLEFELSSEEQPVAQVESLEDEAKAPENQAVTEVEEDSIVAEVEAAVIVTEESTPEAVIELIAAAQETQPQSVLEASKSEFEAPKPPSGAQSVPMEAEPIPPSKPEQVSKSTGATVFFDAASQTEAEGKPSEFTKQEKEEEVVKIKKEEERMKDASTQTEEDDNSEVDERYGKTKQIVI